MKASEGPFQGYVYVATGDPACAKMCLASISSLRDWGCDDYIFIITDLTDIPWPRYKTISHQVSDIDHAPDHASDFSSSYWKTRAGFLSPFTRNIYLDCDMIATSSLEHIWQEVKADGIGLTLDSYPTLHHAMVMEYQRILAGGICKTFSLSEHHATAEAVTLDGPYYNGGIVCWEKNGESLKFFSHWHDEWKRFSGRDQFALVRALKASGVDDYCLSEAYNFNSRYCFTLAKAMNRHITFVHFWGIDNKRAFYAFSKQISAFKALDPFTRKKLEAAFQVPNFRDRDILKLFPRIFILSPLNGFRLLVFIARSIFSILCPRTPME